MILPVLRRKRRTCVSNERYKAHGFTIIEVLIVVVVIAVLATITVVTYNNIQSRTYASKLSLVARHYTQTLALYKEEFGSYPITLADLTAENTNVLGACLGDPESYTHIEESRRMCRWGQTKFYSETVVNNRLAKFDTSPPDIGSSLKPIDLGPVFEGGPNDYTIGLYLMVHQDTTLDGQPHPYWLQYFVPINDGCYASGVATYKNGDTWPNLSSSSGAKATTSHGGGLSTCLIPLPV